MPAPSASRAACPDSPSIPICLGKFAHVKSIHTTVGPGLDAGGGVRVPVTVDADRDLEIDFCEGGVPSNSRRVIVSIPSRSPDNRLLVPRGIANVASSVTWETTVAGVDSISSGSLGYGEPDAGVVSSAASLLDRCMLPSVSRGGLGCLSRGSSIPSDRDPSQASLNLRPKASAICLATLFPTSFHLS